MDIQRVSAGRGAAWINQSIGLLKSGGKAIWLPALVVGVLASMPLIGAAFGILIVFFYGGLVLCFDRPNAGFDAFSGFRDGGFGRLAPVLLMNLALGIVAIVAVNDGRASVAVGVTDDLVGTRSAVDLVRVAAAALGGQGGGGRPDMAQAGGTQPENLDAALASVVDWVKNK
mgnify:CR=1 FL=1